MGAACSRDGHAGRGPKAAQPHGHGHGHSRVVPRATHLPSSHVPRNQGSSTAQDLDLVAKMQNIQLRIPATTILPSRLPSPAEVGRHQLMETARDEDNIQKLENATSPTLRSVSENDTEESLSAEEVQNIASSSCNILSEDSNEQPMKEKGDEDGIEKLQNATSSALSDLRIVSENNNEQLVTAANNEQLVTAANNEQLVMAAKVKNMTSSPQNIPPGNNNQQMMTEEGDEECIQRLQTVTSMPHDNVPQNNSQEPVTLDKEVDWYSDYEETCPICLEGYDNENPQIITECTHHFHLSCILEWMERKVTCPMCDQVMIFDEA